MIGYPGVRRVSPISVYGGDVPTLLYQDPALGGDGTVRLNPDKGAVSWRWVAASYNGAIPVTIPALATRTLIATVKTNGGNEDGDYEVGTILANVNDGSGTFMRSSTHARVISPTVDKYLSNRAVPTTLLSGTSQLPGALVQGIYCLPKTSWQFYVTNPDASSSVSATIALWGRKFRGCPPCAREPVRARAEHLKWFHPYWIVPEDPSTPTLNGPEVSLAAGRSVKLTFPVPPTGDFLLFGMLDESSSSLGGEPALYAQVFDNITGRGLVDLPSTSSAPATISSMGISWRDFLAVPTITGATGFQQSKVNAFSLSPQNAGFTHFVPRNSQIVVQFTSMESSATITLRPALFGLVVYGKQTTGSGITSLWEASQRERVAQGVEFVRRVVGMDPLAPDKVDDSKDAGRAYR